MKKMAEGLIRIGKKKCCASKDAVEDAETRPREWGEYLQIASLIKVSCPDQTNELLKSANNEERPVLN